jgi:hypothetical protein
MSGERVDPFGDLSLEEFKPRQAKKPLVPAAIRQVSEESGFPSRAPAPPAAPAPAAVAKSLPRRRRTGRNVQLNLKVTADDLARFTKMADEEGLVFGELFGKMLDAYARDLKR